jgi:hypothetical protein
MTVPPARPKWFEMMSSGLRGATAASNTPHRHPSSVDPATQAAASLQGDRPVGSEHVGRSSVARRALSHSSPGSIAFVAAPTARRAPFLGRRLRLDRPRRPSLTRRRRIEWRLTWTTDRAYATTPSSTPTPYNSSTHLNGGSSDRRQASRSRRCPTLNRFESRPPRSSDSDGGLVGARCSSITCDGQPRRRHRLPRHPDRSHRLMGRAGIESPADRATLVALRSGSRPTGWCRYSVSFSNGTECCRRRSLVRIFLGLILLELAVPLSTQRRGNCTSVCSGRAAVSANVDTTSRSPFVHRRMTEATDRQARAAISRKGHHDQHPRPGQG